jgi:hypothetical protein
LVNSDFAVVDVELSSEPIDEQLPVPSSSALVERRSNAGLTHQTVLARRADTRIDLVYDQPCQRAANRQGRELETDWTRTTEPTDTVLADVWSDDSWLVAKKWRPRLHGDV